MGELRETHREQCIGSRRTQKLLRVKERKSRGSGKIRSPRKRGQDPRKKVKSPAKRRCCQNLSRRAKAQRGYQNPYSGTKPGGAPKTSMKCEVSEERREVPDCKQMGRKPEGIKDK